MPSARDQEAVALDVCRVGGRGLCSGCSGRVVNENQESV